MFSICSRLKVCAAVGGLIGVLAIFAASEALAATCLQLEARNIINVICSGVIPNDGIDDTPELQAIFGNLNPGQTVYFPPGTYLVRWVTIPGNVEVTGRVKGEPPGVAELILDLKINPTSGDAECWDSSPIFEVIGENVRISDLKFNGSAVEHPGYGHSLSIDTGGYCSGAYENTCICPPDNKPCKIGAGSSYRAAIRADGRCGSGMLKVDGLRVKRNEFVNMYGGSIVVRDADDIEIADNHLTDGEAPFAHLSSLADTIDPLMPTPQFVKVRIRNNRITNVTDSVTVLGKKYANAMVVGVYEDVRIERNIVTNVDRTLVRLTAWDAVVAENKLSGNLSDYAAIDVHGNSKDIVIRNNEFSDVYRGITLNTSFACENIKMLGNTISNTRSDGILIAQQCKGPNIIIKDNKLTEIGKSTGEPCIIQSGIDVAQAVDGLTVKRNVIRGFAVRGDPCTQGNAVVLRHVSPGVARNYRFIGNQMTGFVAVQDGARLFSIFGYGFYENLGIRRNRMNAGGPEGRGIWAAPDACDSVGCPAGQNFICSGKISRNFIDGKTAGTHSGTALIVKNNKITGTQGLVGGALNMCTEAALSDASLPKTPLAEPMP